MTIDSHRILSRLSSSGFLLAFEEETGRIVYTRGRGDDLFERISIGQGYERGGRLGELVYANVECAIVPGHTALKGMVQSVCLTEIASDPGSGWTTLSNEEDARRWEDMLASVAPDRASAFADEVGFSLLEETRQARAASNRYLRHCAVGRPVEEALANFRFRATPSQLTAADRVLSQPIVCIPGGHVFYEVAALVIATFCSEVEGDPAWLSRRASDSDQDRSLMIRLQILASRLAREPGW